MKGIKQGKNEANRILVKINHPNSQVNGKRYYNWEYLTSSQCKLSLGLGNHMGCQVKIKWDVKRELKSLKNNN